MVETSSKLECFVANWKRFSTFSLPLSNLPKMVSKIIGLCSIKGETLGFLLKVITSLFFRLKISRYKIKHTFLAFYSLCIFLKGFQMRI